MTKRSHLLISGRVQGVCFRMYAREQAHRLNITGWVKNLSDGKVEVLAEGEEAALDSLHEWCRKGPPHAKVTNVEQGFSEATGEFEHFEVVYW